MSHDKSKSLRDRHLHSTDCGCTPRLLADMVEHAGLELSRRSFIKGVSIAGGVLAAGGLDSVALAATTSEVPEAGADSIYFGGPILTITKYGDRAEALTVKNGKILAIGDKAVVLASKGANTRMIDLGGNCLMPGFIDPHTHFDAQLTSVRAPAVDRQLP